MATPTGDLRLLINAVLDGRASEDDFRALEEAAKADPRVIAQYVDAMNLHASMHWDYGGVGENGSAAAANVPATLSHGYSGTPATRRSSLAALLGLAALLLVALTLFRPSLDGSQDNLLVDNKSEDLKPTPTVPEPVIAPEVMSPPEPVVAANNGSNEIRSSETPDLASASGSANGSLATMTNGAAVPSAVSNNHGTQAAVTENAAVSKVAPNIGSAQLVSYINGQLQQRWRDEGITPSPQAEPLAWLRRASLDLRGRIPTRDEIESFLAGSEARRREEYVESTLADDDFAEHFATVWSNLLVGRSSQRAVYRDRLRGYLSDAFAANRSWGDVAGELVAAEGPEQNPPTNFLLAHLNNEAVPATAITSRVLLGRQLQCSQCHSHPFNDWKQDQFWELNAFFQQCEVEQREGTAGESIQVLVDRQAGGPTFFETRRGLMQVAYPIYGGERIDESPTVNRRSELARLIVAGEKTDLAEAMVNRMWSHFMGVAFTQEVDDLGPHAAISHPELLDRLTREFVASGYDVKQLVRWITSSAPYQLSADWTEANSFDRPEIGEPALFSRMYEKSLSPEQLYDSLVTAAAGPDAVVSELPSRGDWVAEFYAAQENEENSEMSTFEATSSVALELMNGKLVSLLVAAPESVALTDVLTMKASEDERLNAISLLVLGRAPSAAEKKTLKKVLRPTIDAYSQELPRVAAAQEGFRDLFWAYVNSSEFAVNR